jgi:hypothetical protein
MAVTHSTAAKDAACNAVVDLLDGAGSKLIFRLSGSLGSPGTEVATLTFATPAFGASSSGVATAGSIASDEDATGNASPVATATLQTSGDTIHIHCAVTADSGDIDMSNGLTVAEGDTVSCSSLTYEALAS